MKIKSLDARSLDLPYKKPLITAANRFVTAEGFLIRVCSDDGMEGYGYTEVFPRTGETKDSVKYAVEQVIKPVILARDLWEIASLRQTMNRVLIGNPRAKAGIDIALNDLLAKSLHVPLYVLLGGLARDEIEIIRMLSLGEPEEMAEEAQDLVQQGFRALKLKVSGNVGLDVRRVTKVRNSVGDDVFIKVDANEAYDVKSAIKVANELADLEVEVFEQPVPRFQTQALLEVKKHAPIRVEADQSVWSVADAYRLIQNGAVDSINTSILKAGGIFEARQIAEMCAMAGVGCVLGNTAGSVVGDAAALHLACSVAGISRRCELGEFETVSDDPIKGPRVEKGVLKVPHTEGLGIEPAKDFKF